MINYHIINIMNLVLWHITWQSDGNGPAGNGTGAVRASGRIYPVSIILNGDGYPVKTNRLSSRYLVTYPIVSPMIPPR